jgi:membrane-bound lytic murein transglycosylase B
VSADELRAILDDARAQEVYRSELYKYATPRSVKIQNKEHKSFLKVFMRKEKIAKGVVFSSKHEKELSRAEARFGVKREDIVSVLMWESNLGEMTGKYLVVNTYLGEILFLDEVFAEIEKKDGVMSPPQAREQHLKRLARLKENASRFLIALLRSAKAKHVDPLEIRGSWAGAIGFPQFMPTSMRFAVDGDDDGRIDLYTFPDAIFSIANYLEAHGYKADRSAAIYEYNADNEYVRGVEAYADAIAKRASP